MWPDFKASISQVCFVKHPKTSTLTPVHSPLCLVFGKLIKDSIGSPEFSQWVIFRDHSREYREIYCPYYPDILELREPSLVISQSILIIINIY